MSFKKFALHSLLVSATLLGAELAQATCTTTGFIQQVTTNGTTTSAYVALGVSPLVTNVRQYSTTDDTIANALVNSLHKYVYITGSATVCPVSRFSGIQNAGSVTSLTIN